MNLCFCILDAFWERQHYLSYRSKSRHHWHLFFGGSWHRLDGARGAVQPKAMSCTPVWWWEHGSKGHPADASLLPVTSKAWGVVWATEHRCTMEQSQCVILNSDYWVTCNRPQKHLQKKHIVLAILISIYQQSSCSNVNPAIPLFHLPYPIVWKVPLLCYLNISSLSLKQNY